MVVYTYSTEEAAPCVKLEIILNSGVTVGEYHAYVGDDPALNAAAPGSYTDIQYPPEWVGQTWKALQVFEYCHGDVIDGEAIDLVDDDGKAGVWIGLHLVACRTVAL